MDLDPKIDLVRRLYIQQGRSLSDLAISYDIAMFVLKSHCKTEKWDEQREAHQQKAASTDPNNSLSRHESIVNGYMLKLEELWEKNLDPTLSEGELRRLRVVVENANKITESMMSTIEYDRKIHGVKNTAPSVQQDVGEEHGVAYQVKLKESVEGAAAQSN